jgi:hypothetical protein
MPHAKAMPRRVWSRSLEHITVWVYWSWCLSGSPRVSAYAAQSCLHSLPVTLKVIADISRGRASVVRQDFALLLRGAGLRLKPQRSAEGGQGSDPAGTFTVIVARLPAPVPVRTAQPSSLAIQSGVPAGRSASGIGIRSPAVNAVP